MNEKDVFVCEIVEEKETKRTYADGVLLVSLGNDFFNKSKAVLEFSGFKTSEFSKLKILDYEYFVIVLSAVLRSILQRLTRESIISQEIRFFFLKR